MKEYFKNFKNKKFWISIFCLLGLQLASYMIVKLFQSHYNTFNFDIDKKIPFVPQLIILYNLFYPVVFFAFYTVFNKDEDTYYKGVIAGIIGYIIADIIFLIYPVEMIRPDITNLNIDPINNLILYWTYKLDTPAINCFPSMHCVFCFQSVYTMFKAKNTNKTTKSIYIILLLSIVLTTLLVKQHYLIDIIGALVIVIVCNTFVSIIKRDK